jgi:hypothetical protein
MYIDKLKFYTAVYGRLKNRLLPYWFLAPLRRVMRFIANKSLPKYFLNTKVNNYDISKIQKDLIVSFTSFPARIDYVWMVVETIKRQTLLPEKIILWLSKSQFSNEELPQNLKDEIDELFEVRFVDGDIRSHKKYYYAAKKFPGKNIFLIDDDILYRPNLLEKIWAAHLSYLGYVICNYGFLIKYDEHGMPLPDKYWTENYSASKDSTIFFGSGGGTLIVPSKLYQDLTNIDLAKELTPIADDVWLNAMVRLACLPCYMRRHGLYLRLNIPYNEKLSSLNVGDNQNDQQIKAVSKYYLQRIGVDPFKQKS